MSAETGMTTHGHERKEVSRVNLYFATFVVYVGAFALGNIFSWTSPSLPKLEAADSWLFVDSGTQASWVGSLVSLGAACGPLLSALLLDRVGRRPTIVLSIFIGIAAWIILYPAQQLWTVYLSRLVGGVGGGMICVAMPLYVAEISQKEVRSALTGLFNFSFTAGLVLEYVVGPYVSFGVLILVSCAAPMLFFVLSSWLPESPYFLLRRGQEREALVSLSWLRPGASDQQLLEEIDSVKESIAEVSASKGGLLELVRRPGLRRGMVAAMGSVVFQMLTGINVVLFYTQNIFQLAGETSLDTSESTIVVGVILLAAAGVGVPLTHRFGIRRMMAVSAAGMTVFLAVMGAYLYLLTLGFDTSSYNWLPITCLVCYVIIYSSGFGPGSWGVVAEVLHPDVKSAVSAMAASLCWLVNFLLTWLFPVVVEYWGLYVVFWAFTVLCALALVFVLTVLPDTRGMSLQEIQDSLNSAGTSTGYGVDNRNGWSKIQNGDIITVNESKLERVDTCIGDSTFQRVNVIAESSKPMGNNATKKVSTRHRVDIADKRPTPHTDKVHAFDGVDITNGGSTLHRVDITEDESMLHIADVDIVGSTPQKVHRVTGEKRMTQRVDVTEDQEVNSPSITSTPGFQAPWLSRRLLRNVHLKENEYELLKLRHERTMICH